MSNKVLLKLTCRVCGKPEWHRGYLGRWPSATTYQGKGWKGYQATQICSESCLLKERGLPISIGLESA